MSIDEKQERELSPEKSEQEARARLQNSLLVSPTLSPRPELALVVQDTSHGEAPEVAHMESSKSSKGLSPM